MPDDNQLALLRTDPDGESFVTLYVGRQRETARQDRAGRTAKKELRRRK
jgi:hypothetical protein